MREYSYGVVPLKKNAQQEWQVLLIQHHAGHWSFPKGHADKGETAQQAAARELYEEAGLTIRHYLSEKPLEENYFFTFKGQKVHKIVQYFIAEVEGHVKIQEAEIKDSRWVSLYEAHEYVTFPEGKRICSQVQHFLANRSSQ